MPDFGDYQKTTLVNTIQSDIRSEARAVLNTLKREIKSATVKPLIVLANIASKTWWRVSYDFSAKVNGTLYR